MALTEKLSNIADAIRAKTGKTEKLTLGQMPAEIAGIIGGGECSGNHIIEVTQLPTENIDSSAVYLCGGAYYKYVEVQEFADILAVADGEAISLSSFAVILGMTFSMNIIQTKTTEGILASDLDNGLWNFYYVEDEKDVFLYTTANGWIYVADVVDDYNGVISDRSEAVSDGNYALVCYNKKFEKYSPGTVVVQVAALPVEDIDENLVYALGDGYYRYVKEFGVYSRILEMVVDVKELLLLNGIPCSCNMIPTKTTDGILETTDSAYHFYYIEDEAEVFFYKEGEWVSADATLVSDESEVLNGDFWAIVYIGWKDYYYPSGALTITENGTFDIAGKRKVIANIADAAIYGIYTLHETIDRCPFQEVNFIYTNDNGELTHGISIGSTGLDGELIYHKESGSDFVYNPCYGTDPWYGENYRTIDFGSDPQLVMTKFKEWLLANATRIEESSDDRYDEGIEEGKQQAQSDFWDIYQDYGNRNDYSQAFCYGGAWLNSSGSNVIRGWCDEIYNPKYPIIMNGAWRSSGTFQHSGITDTKVDIIAYGAANFNSTFNGALKLKTIRKLSVTEQATFSSTFGNCTALENITFEGTIGSAISFINSSLLTDVSVQSIIDHLKDLTGTTAQTLTLHATVGGNLTAEQKAAITAKNWNLVY